MKPGVLTLLPLRHLYGRGNRTFPPKTEFEGDKDVPFEGYSEGNKQKRTAADSVYERAAGAILPSAIALK
jgi:hypothetical protein